MRNPFIIVLFLFLTGCSPVPMIALSDNNWKPLSEMPVKGRSGFFLRQKLSFGDYRTLSVRRSWITGTSLRTGFSFPNDWLDRMAIEWVRRKQTVRFSLTDGKGHISEVTALAKVQWHDLVVASNPNSLVSIMANMQLRGGEGNETYAVRIFTDRQQAPWEMFIDTDAAMINAQSYTGLLAKNKDEYYTIVPVYKLRNRYGEAVNLPFGGSVGFEFKNPEGKIQAAVSMIGNGTFFLGDCSEEEKFLLANAAAALLLRQLLDEGVR